MVAQAEKSTVRHVNRRDRHKVRAKATFMFRLLLLRVKAILLFI